MKIYFIFILVLALIFTSSNIYAADSDEMQRSGFLSTYDGLKQSDEYKGLQANEMQQLAEAFHKSIIKALSDKYHFVSEPGPGVIRIRLALTNVEPIKLGADFLTAVVPVGIALNLVKVGATGTSIGVGRTSMEAEIFDTQSKMRLLAAIDTDVGKKYSGYKGDTKWSHAEGTFEAWAKDLRKMLDKLTGRK